MTYTSGYSHVNMGVFGVMSITFGERVEEARRKAGFESQVDVAREAERLARVDPVRFQKFSSQWLSRLENDKTGEIINSSRGPKLRTLQHVIRMDLGAPRVPQNQEEPVSVSANPEYPPFSPEFAHMPITASSSAAGKRLTQARHAANMDLIQAGAASGVNAIIIAALEEGHDITEMLTIRDIRALPKAFGLSQAEFSEIMDLQIITPSALSKPLQAVAKALLDAED